MPKRISAKKRRVTPSSPVKKISAEAAESVLTWYYATEMGYEVPETTEEILSSVAEDLEKLNPMFAGRVRREVEEMAEEGEEGYS
jgi:hypothetical protein